MNIFIIIFFTIYAGNCLRLRVKADRKEGPVCLYQFLTNNERYKYQLEVNSPKYRASVIYLNTYSNQWQELLSQEHDNIYFSISKFAEVQTRYGFCVASTQQGPILAKFNIQFGLQAANTQLFPTKTDTELLIKQISEIISEKDRIIAILQRKETSHSNYLSSHIVKGTFFLYVAILGLFFIIIVNIIFYKRSRSNLKNRKII